jgi:uncharacterized damage-inducible protein DinB
MQESLTERRGCALMQAKDILSDQLLANANDPSWYATFEESVAGLDSAKAFWKPDPDSNSIAEIIQHLLYWNEVWQIRFREGHVSAVPAIENNDMSFAIAEGQNLETLKSSLLVVLLRWQELLTPEKLEADVTGFPEKAQWWGIVANVTTHNAYHIGQIVYIRKLQHSWSR